MKSLKTQNLWKYIFYIVIQIIILYSIIIYKQFLVNEIKNLINEINFKNIFILSLFPLIAIIINGIFNSDLKANIVFWRLKYPLPGSRVFSELLEKDLRINIKEVKKKYGKLPKKPEKQNKLWYKICTKNINDLIVIESHKIFLLLRDISTFNFLILIIFPIVLLIFNIEKTLIIYYSLYLLFQYIIINISTINYGNRFVCNVIVRDLFNKSDN